MWTFRNGNGQLPLPFRIHLSHRPPNAETSQKIVRSCALHGHEIPAFAERTRKASHRSFLNLFGKADGRDDRDANELLPCQNVYDSGQWRQAQQRCARRRSVVGNQTKRHEPRKKDWDYQRIAPERRLGPVSTAGPIRIQRMGNGAHLMVRREIA
jgi:hypothetical protein